MSSKIAFHLCLAKISNIVRINATWLLFAMVVDVMVACVVSGDVTNGASVVIADGLVVVDDVTESTCTTTCVLIIILKCSEIMRVK